LTAKNLVIDGEIAALDQNGRSSLQLLQSYGMRKNIPLVYYAFDLLKLEGTDLRNRLLVERRKLLAKVLNKAPENIRFSEELTGAREELLQIARKFQLEGLIAKKPLLVAQIKFTEWTSDNQLRQPVFLGLRTDKQAKNVVRE
jgi:bifunctional non-homologous end joining protein LigD